jgi:two-component system KDP operon response regulator KdpE
MTTVLQRANKRTMAADRPRVLIVDDEAVVRMLLQDICAEQGWDVVVAATADDALLAAGLQDMNLVLLDLHLGAPHGDPLDTLRALRVISPATPIVVVTGQPPKPLAKPVAEAGGQGVVGKPCSVTEVEALLRRYDFAAGGEAAR